MAVNLTIKYVYGGSKGDDPKGLVHQIPQHKISKYLKGHDTQNVLSYQDIVELLKSDGAQFYPNSIRYYDPNAESYFRMEKDFTFELTHSSNRLSNDVPLVLRLWIKDANFVLRSKITALSHRVKQLEQNQDGLPRQTRSDSKMISLGVPRLTTGTSYLSPLDRNVSLRQANLPSLGESENSPMANEDYPLPLMGKFFSSYQYENNSLQPNPVLDIAIMYAEPLARNDGKATQSLPDAVDYEEESNKIYETLENKKLKIHLAIEIASRDNLVKVLTRNPVILHILCHGEYDKILKKFYLCFETSDGELDPFYADDLRNILSRCGTNIKLVFVNACHSEPVARVFADAGVPCVIAVQSQLQIADVIARKFANEFYHFIFDGHTLGESFDKALLASRSKDSRSCCCGHQHKPNCKWHQLAIKENYNYAHLFHDPLCLDCPKKHEHIHKEGCKWANDFMGTYGPDDWFNVDSEFQTCCCSPELPHDEVLKFTKIAKDPEDSDKLVLYQPKEQGGIIFRKQNSILEKKFPVEKLIGRNKLTYDLFKILRGPQRFVQLVGKTGVGKTALAKQIANYLHARNYFRNKIAIINMDKFYSLSSFLSELYSEEEYVNDLKGFCEAMKSKDALFILDKCDSFIQTNPKEFFTQLEGIIQSTRNVRFMFILNQPLNYEVNIAKVEVGNLYPTDAAKMLLANTPLEKVPLKYRNIEELKTSDLFSKYSTISPQIVWLISTSLINGQSFDKIQRDLLKNLGNVSEDNQSDLAIEQTLREIQEQNKEGFSLITKLGIFPGGLLSLDMKELIKYEFISEDWRTTLASLFAKETDETARSTPQSDDSLPISTGDFLWIQISKIPNSNGVLLKPTQIVNEFLMREFQKEIKDLELKRLQYLTVLSLSLLAKIRSLSVYHEKLLENSAVCKHGLWAIAEDNTFYQNFIKEKAFIVSYLDNPSIKTAKDIQNLYHIHEPNLSSSLRISLIKSIVSNAETNKEALDVIEILWFATLTLYKIFSKNPEAVISFASKMLGLLNELDVKGNQVALLRIKLHLFIIGIIIKHRRGDISSAENEFKSEVRLINEWKSEITDPDTIQRINFELEFARAYFLYRQKKDKLGEETQKRFQDIVKILKETCDKILGTLHYQTDIDRAKVALLLSKVQLLSNKGTADAALKERLFKGAKEFQRYSSRKLELQTYYCIGLLHLQ